MLELAPITPEMIATLIGNSIGSVAMLFVAVAVMAVAFAPKPPKQ